MRRLPLVLLLLAICPSAALGQSTPAPPSLPPMVAVHVSMYELSHSKLQSADATIDGASSEATQTRGFANLISADPSAGQDSIFVERLFETDTFSPLITALKKSGALTVLAEVKVVTTDGGPGTYSAVGRSPIVIPGPDGKPTIEFKKFGTEFECTPKLLGKNRVRVDVRPRVSRINGAAVPPVNVRQFFSEFDGLEVSPLTVVDNAVLPTFHVSEFEREFDMNVSQTFVACGMIEHRPVGESTETFELVVTVRVELLEVPKVARLPQQ